MEKKPDVNLNYRQAVNLFDILNQMQGATKAGAQAYNAVGSIWASVGLQIGALRLDQYDEPVPVEGWQPFGEQPLADAS